MAVQFLEVPFAQKDAVKALGARFDWASKRWYVPAGIDPGPFARWCVVAAPNDASAAPTELGEAQRGSSLSALLGEVCGVVSERFREALWVRAEVVPFEPRRGHLYLDLVEQSSAGQELARARALIWLDDRERVVGSFEAATGIRFAGGIKILAKVLVTMHPRFGLSLTIREIDPDYTLGELALRRRRIRAQLIAQGIYLRNREQPLPGDFFRVVVVAPEGAAGLGDFRKEADRLAQRGLCQFDYRFAVFQGDGAAQSLSAAITAAGQWALRVGANAIAISRGGGATADLHWLDDLAIAEAVCLAPVPVLTGIGHERDQTLLDEVARLAAGTPSKLIQYIESVMFGAAQQAQTDWDEILVEAASQLQHAQAALDQSRALMAEAVRARCVLADQILGPLRREVLAGARHRAASAVDRLDGALRVIDSGASTAVRVAAHAVAAYRVRLAPESLRRLGASEQGLAEQRLALAQAAWRSWSEADVQTRREIAQVIGLGPRRTLQRGFAIARVDGQPLGSLAKARGHSRFLLEFQDGHGRVQWQEDDEPNRGATPA